jgi:hypothetical protein
MVEMRVVLVLVVEEPFGPLDDFGLAARELVQQVK